jgi:hypothetical protein
MQNYKNLILFGMVHRELIYTIQEITNYSDTEVAWAWYRGHNDTI